MFARKNIIAFGLILSLFTALLPFSKAVADVTSVSPNSIFNDVATIITVEGTGFDATSRILLDGVELPGTVYISDTSLQVTVPAGVSVGAHIITVNNTGGSAVLNVSTPAPTATPPPTATLPFARPQMQVTSSGVGGKDGITSNKSFKFSVNFKNAGNMTAYNTQATFTSPDLLPLETGGVAVLGNVSAGGNTGVEQRFVSNGSLAGKTVVSIDVTLTYYDDKGTAYSDKFTFTASVTGGGGGGGGVYYTPTPTGVRSGQLIITSYKTSIDPLQPGSQFDLILTVQNVGNEKAQRVTMIVGGGGAGGSSGTPGPGGVSGGSGEFTNFAPIGASNVQSLGDVPAGGNVQATQELIVNVSTNPGAYPMKMTFSYVNGKGEVVNDEQVITLLVYSLPNLDVSFYRPPDLFFAGQPGALPIQIVNLGKRLAVLGNIKVTTQNGTIENGTSLIGALDAGGYFTLDAMLFPNESGPTTLNIVIDYTDDFNQPRTIEKTIEVVVEEGFIEPTPDPNMPGGENFMPVEEENFFQKTWRFILGLFGLDSAPATQNSEFQVPPSEVEPAPIPSGGGGKGG